MEKKRLNYNELLEKLLRNYYFYNKQETGLFGRALIDSKRRKILKKALEIFKRAPHEELGSELISRAFWYSKEKHKGQKRISGDPYFVHPYSTAFYLTELNLDAASVAAGLLHDIIEDTETGVSEIRDIFGKEVSLLVESLTKLKKIVSMSDRKEYNITLQKILFATTKDVRVILIKLADKYHNLQTINFLPKEKQAMIAANVLEFYVPVIKKLGMHELKDEFEKICFKIVKPKIHAKIKHKLLKNLKPKEAEMDLVIKRLEPELQKAGLKISFSKYRRTVYSVFKKMTQNLKSFNEVQDYVVLVALAETREECYEFLGLLHNTFSPVPLKFRDHIAISQFALYKSIHTTVIGPNHSPIKVYIRTKQMDALVKKGVSELLRESKADPIVFQKNLSFLNNLMSINFDDLPTKHFIDVLKSDYLQERILVFTLSGNLIELPKRASIIDFAFAVDKETAEKAVKARVNGKLVPLWHELSNGDLVEMLFGKKKRVSKVWENFAISAKARDEIQKHFKGKESVKEKIHLVNFEVKAVDRISLLKDLTEVIVSLNSNIFSAEVKTNYEKMIGEFSFTLNVLNHKKFDALLKKLKKVKGVIEVKTNYIE
ncbi:MAG: HD domain-containing protein [archaeon]